VATQEAGVVCQSIPVCLLVVGADLVAPFDLVTAVVPAEEVGQVHAMRDGRGGRRISRFRLELHQVYYHGLSDYALFVGLMVGLRPVRLGSCQHATRPIRHDFSRGREWPPAGRERPAILS